MGVPTQWSYGLRLAECVSADTEDLFSHHSMLHAVVSEGCKVGTCAWEAGHLCTSVYGAAKDWEQPKFLRKIVSKHIFGESLAVGLQSRVLGHVHIRNILLYFRGAFDAEIS